MDTTKILVLQLLVVLLLGYLLLLKSKMFTIHYVLIINTINHTVISYKNFNPLQHGGFRLQSDSRCSDRPYGLPYFFFGSSSSDGPTNDTAATAAAEAEYSQLPHEIAGC